MTCIQCKKETTIATAYSLPFMVRTEQGQLQNLVACSKECRDQWQSDRREVAAMQAKAEAQP